MKSINTYLQDVVHLTMTYLHHIRLRESVSKANTDDTPVNSQESLLAITNEEDWQMHCGEAFKGICAIGLFSPSAQDGVLVGIDALEAAMKSMKRVGSSFRFLTIDAICHSEFSASFGIQSHELPTLVIYSPSKRRYQILKGSYSEVNYFIYYLLTLRCTFKIS